MSDAHPDRGSGRVRAYLLGWWLLMGLAFQIIYFGFPNPLTLPFWLHLVFWPAFVLLGLLRWFFLPFAVVSLLALGGLFVLRRV